MKNDNGANIETEAGNNGHQQTYEEFVGAIAAGGGVMADGSNPAGIGLIQSPEVKHTNASLIASMPNASSIYKEEEKMKGVLLDVLSRSVLLSHDERIHLLDWIEWCEEFGTGYDGPMRYIVSAISEGGLSREQYVDAITNQNRSNFNNRGTNGQDGNKFKPKYREGELS